MLIIVLLIILLLSTELLALSSLPSRIRLRPAFPDDEVSPRVDSMSRVLQCAYSIAFAFTTDISLIIPLSIQLPISIMLAKDFINPLDISHKNNLIIAEDITSKERVGIAHIKSLGYVGDGIESSNDDKFEDDKSLKSIDVQTRLSIEDDIDEEMWQEFEDDETPFPNGFASLPWTKEYREASQAASDRIKQREKKLEVELQARPKIWQLSIVYVVPKYRRQGIGSSLVKQVLKRQAKQRGRNVYALTSAKTVRWYEKQFGFAVEDQIPTSLSMEINIGNAVNRDDKVCLRKTL